MNGTPGAAGTPSRRPALDGLRAFAATVVVVTHVAFATGHYTDDGLGRALARGDVGVALFFVLSGFLLARPFLAARAAGTAPPATAPYLARRALRILPAYWLAVVVGLLVLPANSGTGAATWLGHLALVQVYGPTWAADGLVHAWSLCVEVAFYALLPVALPWLTGPPQAGWRPSVVLRRLGVLAACGLAWLGVTTAAAPGPPGLGPSNLWLPSFLPWFAAGVALATLAVSGPGDPRRAAARALADAPGTCWAGAAVLFWIATSPLAGPLGLETTPTVAAALTKAVLYTGIAVLVVLPLALGDRECPAARALSGRVPVALGRASYGMFLFHLIVLGLVRPVLAGSPIGDGMPVVLAATWGAAALAGLASHRLVEGPLMRLGARSIGRAGVGTGRRSE